MAFGCRYNLWGEGAKRCYLPVVKSRKLVTLRLLAGQMFFNFVENRITSGKERCDAKRVCTYANCARDYGGHESVINMAFNGSRSIYSGARSNNGTTGPVLMLINFKCISKITTPRRGELGNINVINRRQNRDLKAPMERWYHCLVVARSLSL